LEFAFFGIAIEIDPDPDPDCDTDFQWLLTCYHFYKNLFLKPL
jgi:hypothetical protein